jgi:hypothetical protein
MSAAMGILLMAGMTSCANDEELTDVTEKGDYQIEFSIQAGEDAVTRTIDWDDLDEEEGVGYENYINPNKIWVYILTDLNNSFATVYQQLKLSSIVESGTNTGKFTLRSILDETTVEKLKSENFRVVILTNWEDGATPKTANYGYMVIAADSRYSYNPTADSPFLPSATTPITMYGIQSFSPQTFRQGVATNLGTIKLIRSMAKIEVKLADDDKTNQLSDVTLLHSYDCGMRLPYYMQEETVQPTEKYQNIPGDGTDTGTVNTLSNLPFYKKSDNDYIIYIPEYRLITPASYSVFTRRTTGNNRVTPDPTNKITIKLNNVSYDLEFKEYDDAGEPIDGTTFNIVRNHIYRYTVSLAGGKFTLQYMVIPWTERTAPMITFE